MASEMDAGEVMTLLTMYQSRLVPLIQQHGGTIDKFMGDGIMATFGAANENETASADALKAVDAIFEEVDQWAGEGQPEQLGQPEDQCGGGHRAGIVRRGR